LFFEFKILLMAMSYVTSNSLKVVVVGPIPTRSSSDSVMLL